MQKLELVQTATLGVPLPGWAHGCLFDGSRCGVIAFPAAPDYVLAGSLHQTSSLRKLPVPANAGHIAVHSSLTRMGALCGHAVTVHDENGAVLVQRDFPKEDGELKALAFDASGSVLFVSAEAPDRGGAIDHDLYALDSATLDEIATATTAGDVEAGHSISIHPSQPVVAFEVGCGQDGCWTNIFALDGKQLVHKESIDPGDDYAPVVVFSPTGNYFAGWYPDKILLWEWPSAKVLARAELEDGKFFIDSIGFRGDRLAVVVDDDDLAFKLEERSLPDLEIVATTDLPLPENAHAFEVLGGDFLSSHYVTNKKRISPADCKPESETFQLWRIT